MRHTILKPAATLLALACTAGLSGTPAAAAPPEQRPAARAGAAPAARAPEASLRRYNVTARDGGIIPGHIRIRKGDKVRITFTSKDDKYSIRFKDFGVKETLTPEIPVTIEITPNLPGSYDFKCTRLGFKRFAGANGTLVVTD
jgi:heme/copper-type cytochrome/quinol oxidase subunit 2